MDLSATVDSGEPETVRFSSTEHRLSNHRVLVRFIPKNTPGHFPRIPGTYPPRTLNRAVPEVRENRLS